MAKSKLKNQTETLTKRTTKCKVSENQIRKRERQKILRALQQAIIPHKNTCKINNDTNSNRTARHAENEEHAFANTDCVQSNANENRDENVAYNNKCYRCVHFLETPRNLFESFRENASDFVNRCESELSFVQAIVLLKSAASCTSAISVERLQEILRKCCTRDNHTEDERIKTDVRNERPKSPVREDLSKDKNTPNASDFLNISGLSGITPTNSQKTLEFATYNSKEDTEFLTQQRWNGYASERVEKGDFSTKSRVISETNTSPDIFESADALASPDMFESPANGCDLSDKSPSDKSLVITEPAASLNIDTSFWKQQNGNFDLTPTSNASVIFSLSNVYDDLEFRNSGNDSAYSTSNILQTQVHRSSLIFSKTFWERSNNSNVKTDQIQMADTLNENGSCLEFKDTQKDTHTGAVDTLDVAATNRKRVIKNKHINSEHSYNLRVRKTKICTSCVEQNSKIESCKKKKISKKEKKEEENEEKQTISTNWLNFTLESLNALDRVLFESLDVILSTLRNERTAEEYATRRRWKDTLEREAVTAVLNISDIFRTEKKPDVCGKKIVTSIIKTVDEMVTHVQQNKTSTWIYRIQIILELCNSLPICVKVIDHLITKLTWFQSMRGTSEIDQNTHTMRNKLRLVLYALDVALQKYRTIIPSIEKSRSARNAISHVADLWKLRYVEKELENAELNLNVVEKQWSNALKDFAEALRNRLILEQAYSLCSPTISILTRYFAH